MNELSVIIVSWNVEGLLQACLRSVFSELDTLFPDSPASSEVFVVDNASRDSTTAMLAEKFPRVQVIANQRNVGFVHANNQALRRCTGRVVCLLNPDCEVRPGALRVLTDYLAAHPDVAAVGPTLLNTDGSVQSSRRRFPTLATAFVESTILQRWLGGTKLVQRYYQHDLSPDFAQEADWLVGACLCLRREALDQVGLLDERFFMYLEEVDWCRRAKQAGWRIVYLPAARVVHHEGKSSEQNLYWRNLHFHESKIRYFAKYHGALAGFLLRCFILLTFLFQIVEESLKLLLVKRNRSMRRQRLAMLARVSRHQFKALLGG